MISNRGIKRYEKEQPAEERETYAKAEIDAKYIKRGLWQDAQPVPPWECRLKQKEGADCGQR